MSYRFETAQAVVRQGVVGIVRTPDAESAVAAAAVLLDAGLHTVELPLTNPGALRAIEQLGARYPEAVLGAGTVLDESAAVLAIRAGARFLVSPNLNTAVIRTASRYGAVSVPGAGTVTEVVQALEAGADLVKVFPASAITPQWVRDLRAAVPQAPLVPTGGIGPDEVPDWLAAGAVACGLGSALTKGTPEQARERITGLLGRLR
ncbi:bifunctional 4-hydroxy-2-oxoglutarate aldolase/2-dehydro-3-deoxy-phosphogluconate aldolase [Kutzneria albida]|uniref:Uncharacterized protein n=1 Tax=Kutzneria albida DSM 43870 TaxID=1449976 RepID=W5W9M3_9PSEU|nr:bifunctional 4-hydroxy-2-oxoglutarate aldolase/2-dehydro-3-deoxy-phosphogluconate aldolase [Kutzneria albida]AHH97231.1 hypothetical protein KALB_3867 [Kutzneria albida DSM 43870]